MFLIQTFRYDNKMKTNLKYLMNQSTTNERKMWIQNKEGGIRNSYYLEINLLVIGLMYIFLITYFNIKLTQKREIYK